MPEEKREGFERLEYDERFYYYTGYGTPLVYARPLDLVAAAGLKTFRGKRVFDFGYGAAGHLRMIAWLGADAVGTEIQPLFRALYSRPEDQGVVRGREAVQGRLELIHGFFPSEEEIVEKVGTGYDLFISKNVLKRGYVHPEREVDERLTVKLGVSDAEFVQKVYRMLRPGGFVMIYNLSPRPNPPDKPYIPWADGRSPFPRELLEGAGFEVLAFDHPDHETAHEFWFALGLDAGKSREELSENLFAHYTLLRKPARR